VTNDLAGPLNSIGALVDPVRRDLYLYVVAQADSVGRDDAAAHTGYPRHAVKFHLDRLVDAGLLEVEYRRLSGRQGPGAGRPAKLYRRGAREVSVSLPERRYDLAGHILATAFRDATGGEPITRAVARAARAAGQNIAASSAGTANTAADLLALCGYEPRVDGDQTYLINCPFHSLALEHTELVCDMNLEFVKGITEAAGLTDDARLDPAPNRCCVALRSRG